MSVDLNAAARSIDQVIAWHLKELARLCPANTKFTLVARIGHSDECLIMGDDPNTKQALFAAIRCLGDKRRMSQSGIQARETGDPVPVGGGVTNDESKPFDPLDLNGGSFQGVVVGEVEQG